MGSRFCAIHTSHVLFEVCGVRPVINFLINYPKRQHRTTKMLSTHTNKKTPIMWLLKNSMTCLMLLHRYVDAHSNSR